MPETIDSTAVLDGYFEMWNTTDAAARRAVIERVWAPDGRSTDPMAAVQGHDEIDAMVGGTQAVYVDHRFRLAGEPDRHHDRLLFFWEMIDGDGGTVVAGLDSVLLADDGRIADLTGFFGPTPSGSAS